MTLKRIVLTAVLFCLSLSIATAQFNSGIQGLITDAGGGSVPDAVVKVTNVATGVAREVTTSNDGLYRVTSLGVGTYRVNVMKPGFAPAERPSVPLGISETIRADFTLKVGALVDQVTVTGEVALVETETGRISGRIEPLELKELPTNGANLFSLLAFQPGVTGRGLTGTFRGSASAQPDSFSGETSPDINANGQARGSNTYTLDDSYTNSPYSNGSNITPNSASVEEVRVVSNNFSAVDGRGSAARIELISKAGSNTFHGGASYYFQNNTLASRNEFESRVSPFRRNQFGYNLGGPIIRNRTFFFTSYEGLRMSGARAQVFTVETPAFRDWVIQALPNSIAATVLRTSQPAVDPTYNFVSLKADPNLVNPPPGLLAYGSASFAPRSFRNGDQFSVRIDHELRPGKDKVFGNFYRTRNGALGTDVQDIRIRPTFDRERHEKNVFLSLNETHIFSPTTLNEFKFGMMRYEGVQADLPHPEIPRLSVSPIATIGDNSFPLHWWQYSFNFQNIFTWVHASHSVKLGGEFRKVPTDNVNTNNYIPRYDFLDLLNFANDNPRQMTRLVNPVTGEPVTVSQQARRIEFALFVQDDWKVTRNFTINVGVRYENYRPATDTTGLVPELVLAPGNSFLERLANASSQYVGRAAPLDNNNFAPRFGFAWNPGGRGKTAVRGGYGITYDRPNAGLGYSSNPPLRATVTLGALFGNTFTYSLGDPSKPFLGYPVDPALKKGLDAHNGINGIRANVSGVDPDYVNAYVHNWMLGVEHEVHPGWVIGANYIGSAGHHLNYSVNVNRYVGDLLDGRFDGYNPSFSSMSLLRSDANSIYHGATAYARRSFTRGFTFETAYTMGKVLTDSDSSFQDVNNRRADRAPSNFDVARRFSILGIWEIPFLKGNKGPAGFVLGGWQLSATTIMQTGQPLNVLTSATWPLGDYNADGAGGDRPNNPAESVGRSGFHKSDFLSGIFKVSDFPKPAPGTDGNLGRNTFRGPGFIQLDASLSKKFPITERLSFQLKLDAYNASNRVNLLEPVVDLNNSANFGRSTDQLTPRALQAYGRFTF